jgi:hypothetical protein
MSMRSIGRLGQRAHGARQVRPWDAHVVVKAHAVTSTRGSPVDCRLRGALVDRPVHRTWTVTARITSSRRVAGSEAPCAGRAAASVAAGQSGSVRR